MQQHERMSRLSDYDYNLPEELIAQEPLEDRSASRLLWLHNDINNYTTFLKDNEEVIPNETIQKNSNSRVSHHRFTDITKILKPGDLLIMNNSRVTALRIIGKKGNTLLVA